MLLQTPSSIVPARLSWTAGLGRTLSLAVMMALGASACDKVPLTAPAGTVITLVATTNVLSINGSTELLAVLIENGTVGSGDSATKSAGTPVHNGTLVTFTTSLGRIEPAEARTINGRVTVVLVADARSGKATVNAFSGAATQKIDILIGAAAAERVTVTATPTSLPSNGGTVTITARVEDVSGNPLTGVPVNFTTTAGTLSSQSVLTNDIGIATTFLSTTVDATVTAASGGKSGSAAPIKVRARSTVELTLPTAALVVGAPAVFTVKPGAVPLTGGTIDFGDGDSEDFDAISASTTFVHYYTDDGVFRVEVRATDIDGGTAAASGSVGVAPFAFEASVTPTTAAVDELFDFVITAVSANVAIDRYVWTFGDGRVVTTSQKSIQHSYQTPGRKTITVTAYPVHGDPRTNTLTVQVTLTLVLF